MKNYLFVLLAALTACSQPTIEMVTTTESSPWQTSTITQASTTKSDAVDVEINTNNTLQEIEGFGTCFNELGWTSLQRLTETERQGIFRELFEPGTGANLTVCRMPVAANDFARDWYSYSEIEGDFAMENFSIANDEETLIPYIKSALKYNANVKLWASPWSPPQWMKYNKHYAAKSILGDWDSSTLDDGVDMRGITNGLPIEREGKEGTDMFIQEPEYFEAYALYFSKFIEAYREQGINIAMVMPQNEFNSTQFFPSCTWTAAGLATFVGEYLGPAMTKLDVDLMFGTMERPTEAFVDTMINDPKAGQYIKGVGFQWGGKNAIAGIHKRYPNMPLYQTEQECGNGKNDWSKCKYSWGLMKHYLNNGTSAYLYWNTSLDEGGISTWGWKQNSLVSVDTVSNTFKYNHEYYLLKHVSHYVLPGAKRLATSGDYDNILAFKNTDGSTILVLQNDQDKAKTVHFKLDDETFSVDLTADSFTTLKL